ncbi:MAG TPA: prepilin-type N-terminal cleavage/methylation domain-containing protein [Tepidisphaeraceae bacterium]|jgi:general secretion pathway protein G
MKKNSKVRSGFSLIELVIVVVIIAIIAAIAVPKMSRGAAGANDSATMQNLSQMRSAIDLFAAEHGGTYPSITPATFKDQLTTYTDISGGTSATKTATHIYGPYLKSIPTLPVGTNKGLTTVTSSGTAPGTGNFAWFYDGSTVWVNNPSTDVDAKGTAYNTY